MKRRFKFENRDIIIKEIKTDCICEDEKYSIKELIESKFSERIKRDIIKYNKEKILSGIENLILKNLEKIKNLNLTKLEIGIEIGYDFNIYFDENIIYFKIKYVICKFLNGINYGYLFNVPNNKFVYKLDKKFKTRLMMEML